MRSPRSGKQSGYPPQPGYGPPPGYGQQPGYGGGPGTPHGRPGADQPFGLIGAVVVGVGAVLLIIAFTALKWYDSELGPKTNFDDVRKQIDDHSGQAAGVAHAYFGWLAWLLLAVAVLAAIGGCVPGAASIALRIVAAVAAAVGILLTFLATKLASGAGVEYSQYIKHVGPGFYLALAGFLLVGVGALIGPMRTSQRSY